MISCRSATYNLLQLPVVREIENNWRINHAVDETWLPRASSVTDDKLWLPISPELQFCFRLDLYDGCPIGMTLRKSCIIVNAFIAIVHFRLIEAIYIQNIRLP